MLRIFKMKKKAKRDKEGGMDYFTDKLSYLFNVLISAYYSSLLKWWEVIIIVIVGALCGVGLGIAVYQLYIKPPSAIYVQLNETHIIKVR